MHIGGLNTVPTYVAIMMKLKIEWDTLAKERGLNCFSSKMIFDDV